MGKILYSKQALVDLQSIKNHITSEFGDSIAQSIMKKITTGVKRLDLFPQSGINLAKNISVATDYYYMFIEKNYVFYRLDADRVYIIRVLNEKQEYMQQIFGVYNETKENEEEIE